MGFRKLSFFNNYSGKNMENDHMKGRCSTNLKDNKLKKLVIKQQEIRKSEIRKCIRDDNAKT